MRKATDNDKEFLWSLVVASMGSYIEQVYGWDVSVVYARFEENYRTETMKIIQCDGQDVGMVELLDNPQEIFLTRIAILPEYQNRGIGSTILQNAIAEAATAHKPLRLQVFKINPARGLYERLGFVKTAETMRHIQMELSL